VSVLFVDLVGYTSLSEQRDAEDARELLSRYFDTARTIVARYGGTVEKFIGDAVMAVWGTPVAREDDAERAVRAGIELVDAVNAFGQEVGAAELQARAGVVTGQVASIATPGEGLVVGDRVNTASRVQSVADPGTVLVDDVTHDVTSSAIAYVDAGRHSVKGKSEPLQLWRAERVVAGVAGSQRTDGLEAPFVGRDSELRLVKELFHASVDRGVARLVAVAGAAGVGKSRLRWEFEKYADGLAFGVLWHSGRCPSYGDGVAYWALAEMVRQRFGIAEEEAFEDATLKLEAGLDRWALDAVERDFLRPRLGALLGVSEPDLGRDELFAGWRLFFERLAEHEPVVLAFEDMQWADSGLLGFIDHLLDWSAQRPIFILAFARPDLAERSGGWPAGRRGATPVYLDPLDERAMGALLDGVVEGLPDQARDRIVGQAEGIPLYALETVRALADRGALSRSNGRFTLAGDLGELDVPASLSSLLAARLDGLEPDERELVKAMAVFGGTFPRSAAAALGGLPEDRLDVVLSSLVRKEILAVTADRLSPDRGQYTFAQTLLRTVAYDLLPKRERKPRHLAAAQHLRSTFPDDGEDVAEVVASHYLDAYNAAPDDADADELRSEALSALRRAGQRAAMVGAPEIAERAYRTAIDLGHDEAERLELMKLAGEMAARAGRLDESIELYEVAAAGHTAAGNTRDAARVVRRLGEALSRSNRLEEAADRMRAALASLDADELDPEVAILNAQLGRALVFAGHEEEAAAPLELALMAAEALELPDVLCEALTVKAIVYAKAGRYAEAGALHETAITLAERNGLGDRLNRAQANSGDIMQNRDIPQAAERAEEAVNTSRRLGDRVGEAISAGNLMLVQIYRGRWHEAHELGHATLEGPSGQTTGLAAFLHARLALLNVFRGRPADSEVAALAEWEHGDEVEGRLVAASVFGTVALAEERYEEALQHAGHAAREAVRAFSPSHEVSRQSWPDAVDAALALGRLDEADELVKLLEDRPPGHIPPFLNAQLRRARGLLAAARGETDGVESQLQDAVERLRKLAYPYWLARAEMDLASWLIGQRRADEAAPLLHEAIELLQPLSAAPALAQARELLASVPATVSAVG
jgi:class 3 adenylate cyclase/tetratricopeptide (TPR) repeat protein